MIIIKKRKHVKKMKFVLNRKCFQPRFQCVNSSNVIFLRIGRVSIIALYCARLQNFLGFKWNEPQSNTIPLHYYKEFIMQRGAISAAIM